MKTKPLEDIYHLKGRMESAYPGYQGTFLAAIKATSARQAKMRFTKIVYDQYPAAGIESPLVLPIIRFETAKRVGRSKACWAVFTNPIKRHQAF